jgi:two-component system OmpR family response regulator
MMRRSGTSFDRLSKLKGLRWRKRPTAGSWRIACAIDARISFCSTFACRTGDGLAIVGKIRLTSNVPIILLSGLGTDVDRIVGLELGADDYVVKPFNPRELVARAKAVLRRVKGAAGHVPSLPAIGNVCRRFAGYVLDLTARRLMAPDGRLVTLTNAEFLLIEAFVGSPGRVLSRDQLLDLMRSRGSDVFDRTIDVLVLRLRRKIEANPHTPRLIRTERGAGYVFDAAVEEL